MHRLPKFSKFKKLLCEAPPVYRSSGSGLTDTVRKVNGTSRFVDTF